MFTKVPSFAKSMSCRFRAQARHLSQGLIKQTKWALDIVGDEACEDEAEDEGENEGEKGDEDDDEFEPDDEVDEEPVAEEKETKEKKVPIVKRPVAAPVIECMKRPAAAPVHEWQYGYDSEHRMAYRMLPKRGSKREWATSLEPPCAIESGTEPVNDMPPIAVFIDGDKHQISTITWGDHEHAMLTRPGKGKLWEHADSHTHLVLKKDRKLLLILYQTSGNAEKQICQIAVKHFGDEEKQVIRIRNIFSSLVRKPSSHFLERRCTVSVVVPRCDRHTQPTQYFLRCVTGSRALQARLYFCKVRR